MLARLLAALMTTLSLHLKPGKTGMEALAVMLTDLADARAVNPGHLATSISASDRQLHRRQNHRGYRMTSSGAVHVAFTTSAHQKGRPQTSTGRADGSVEPPKCGLRVGLVG